MLTDRDCCLAVLILLLGIIAMPGCSPSKESDDSAGDDAPYAASGGLPPDVTDEPGEQQAPAPNEVLDQPSDEMPERPAAPAAVEPDSQPTGQLPQRKLRPDLSPTELIEFLAAADQDLQLIMSGRSGIDDQQQAHEQLRSIVNAKLEASRRLAEHSDGDAKARSEGARGELQALSHLAVMGDLKSAQQLQTLAEKNLLSDDADLVSDSRLVLIGFAIESLQNGKEGAAEKVVELVEGFSQAAEAPDVPALMMLGQARQMLAQYGYENEARKIRDTVIGLYAGTTDPTVAELVAQIAGNVKYDGIEQLRAKIVDGEGVSQAKWKEAVQTLIDESPDLQTVQYLAGASLEFESIGQEELVNATFQTLADHFDDPASATGREVELAIAARQARQQVIGRAFDPDLPSVDGRPLQIADYRGNVVLMPFWATGFPESLQLVPRLREIRDANADAVAIVGMNLDREDVAIEEFVQASELGFRSFRAESSATAKVANPVAAQFGMVSLPFVAILDTKGQVAALNYTGRDLEETVQKLIDSSGQ